jgi:RimJ/RimL family protein N-acetyltransferase
MSLLSNPAQPTYGRHRSLRDGATILLRPLEPSDSHVVREVFDGLGPESRYQRFLVWKQTLIETDLRTLVAVDHKHHEAVTAISLDTAKAVGVARLVRLHDDPGTAEVAVAVVDAWQGRGVGLALAEALVARARCLHVTRFSVVMARGNTVATRLMHRLPGDVADVAKDSHTAEFLVTLRSVQDVAPDMARCSVS